MSETKDIREKIKYCYNCIKPRVCYLPDETDYDGEEIGWCSECNFCREYPDCKNVLTHRIEWDVGCIDQPYRLCRDVCEDHLEIGDDCSCSKSARNKSIKKYIYV